MHLLLLSLREQRPCQAVEAVNSNGVRVKDLRKRSVNWQRALLFLVPSSGGLSGWVTRYLAGPSLAMGRNDRKKWEGELVQCGECRRWC